MKEEWRVVQRGRGSTLKQLWARLRSGTWVPTERFMYDGQVMPPIMGGAPDTVDKQVAASSDDAQEIGGDTQLDTATLSLLHADYNAGFRWTGVNVPSGATVSVAYMEIYLPDDTDDFYDGKTLYAENNNNPGTFTVDADNITNRTKTTASVALGTGGQGTGWKTLPSMVDVVQEVVTDQSGTGDAFVCIIWNTTEEDLEITAWDGDADLAAKLHIEYSAAAAGGIPIIMHHRKMIGAS